MEETMRLWTEGSGRTSLNWGLRVYGFRLGLRAKKNRISYTKHQSDLIRNSAFSLELSWQKRDFLLHCKSWFLTHLSPILAEMTDRADKVMTKKVYFALKSTTSHLFPPPYDTTPHPSNKSFPILSLLTHFILSFSSHLIPKITIRSPLSLPFSSDIMNLILRTETWPET